MVLAERCLYIRQLYRVSRVIYIYIYIYKTEAFEASTIFHISTALKNNNKTKNNKTKNKNKIVINPFPTRLCLFFPRFPFHEYSAITFLPAPPQSHPRQANQTHDNSTPNPSSLPFPILYLSLSTARPNRHLLQTTDLPQTSSDHRFCGFPIVFNQVFLWLSYCL